MMAQHFTTVERLARIESLLEEKVIPELGSVRDEIAEIKAAVDADVKDLGNLKSKGSGLLVGVGLAATAFGTVISTRWKEFLHAIS